MYVEYKVSLEYVLGSLGLKGFEYFVRPELAPFLTAIMKFLSTKLVVMEGYDIKDKIKTIQEIYERGADLICAGQTDDLMLETGYEEDRELFVFCWTNVMTSLYGKLKNQYSSLLCEPLSTGCACDCVGETWKDYEEYTSGIWPEDDEFEWTKKNDSTSSPCNCAERRIR